MSADHYRRLRDDFAALWVSLGNTPFVLEFASPSDPPDLSFGRKRAVYDIVGGACLPFPEGDGHFALAIIKRQPENENQIAEFQTLCAEAGAHLPVAISDVVKDYYWFGNTHPAGWWTALLAHRFGIPATNIYGGWLSRPKIHNPLEISIELIDKLGLATESPGWREATPSWDAHSGTLVWQEHVIRKVDRQATNIRDVLDAFEKANWPARILDPLPGGKNQARVSDTVRRLNAGLTGIRFRADGSGAGFLWELVRD